MIASLLFIAIGAADAARAHRSRAVSVVIGVGVVLAVAVSARLVLAVDWLALGAIAVIAVLWIVTMPDDRARPRIWPVAVLGLSTVGLALVPIAGEGGIAAEALAAVSSGVLADVSLTAVVAVLGVALILTETANIIARATLARLRPAVQPVPSAGRWQLRLGSFAVGSIERAELSPVDPAESPSTLRGGRLIGPIERLLIVALAVAGAHAIIAALLAAKGIVRFPEISADRGTGSKAEEFLIGSLVSWGMAALGALWVWFAQNG